MIAWILANPLLSIAIYFGFVFTVFPWFEVRHGMKGDHL